MRPNNMRWAGTCALGAVLTLSTGCDFADDLLKVDNPEEIQIEALNDPALLDVQLNGVVDAFQGIYGNDIIEFNNYPTDEVITGRNWETHARGNQRLLSYEEAPTNGFWEGLNRGLRLGDGLAERIRGWATDDPSTDFSEALATSLVFAGYSATVLAENFCQAVISPDPDNPSGTVLEQPQVFEVAIPYLTEAHDIATANGYTDLADLARTGLARANRGRANWTEAANWANQVTVGFSWWLDYVDIDGGRNPLEGTSHGQNFSNGIHPNFTGVHPSFDGTGFAFTDDDVIAPQTDPRIQHEITDATGHNALTPLYKLFQGLRYSDYTGNTIAPASAACPNCTGTLSSDMPLIAEFDTDILLADYVEAQHHYFEALAMQGGNDAVVLAFVNARRAVGNQVAVTLSGQALLTELRNQRGRDLFMGGFRLPDLRRWTRNDPGNGPFDAGSYFPTGIHPNAQWGAYGEWTCYPIPVQEYNGNVNLQRPANPTVPPAI